MGVQVSLGRLQSLLVLVALLACVLCCANSQSYGQTDSSLQRTITTLVANEREAAQHRPPFSYLSIERSDRTAGYFWAERVAEVAQGRLRYLLSEDGKPLSEDRRRQQTARLKAIAADPGSFTRHEQSQKTDEQRAQQMFELLPSAFLFRNGGIDGSWLRINYHPNPSYVPRNYAERILHGMSGTMLVDPRALRLHYLEGHLTGDVSFGYGLLATIHSGSSFVIIRNPVAPGVWKTTSVDTRIDGRVIFFKTLSRHQESEHKDFKPLPPNLSIPQAVDLLIQSH